MNFSKQAQQFEDQEFRRESRRIEALEDLTDRLLDEEIAATAIEMIRDKELHLFFPLLYGSRGVKWIPEDKLITPENPLMFTCSLCRKTTSMKDTDRHEKGCVNKLLNELGVKGG